MPNPVSIRREIVAILLIKLALIIAIKLVFFSHPAKPGGEGTAERLLSTSATSSLPARSATHE